MITLFKNGKIHTMENADFIATAFIVDQNKFVYVGDKDGALEFIKEKADEIKEVDLKGRLVLPGFNDSHMHFLHYAKNQRNVNLVGAKSIMELRLRIVEGIKSRDVGNCSWLIGEGWNHDYFTDEKRFPTKFDLDDITDDIPLLIMRACFHVGVLNSAGLKELGLNRETAVKYGDLIELLPSGEPNGVIKESLLDNVKTKISPISMETLKNILIDAQKKASAQGLTSVQSDDFGYIQDNDYNMLFQAFKELKISDNLNIRIGEQCLFDDRFKAEKFFDKGYGYGFGTDKYRVNCVKILSDGSLGARTAAMRNPYADDPGTKGIGMFSQDELNKLVLTSHSHGCPVAIHAIGDKALEMSLDAIEYSKKARPDLELRHGIVHCQITDDALLERIKNLNVITFVQPIFIDYDMNIVYDRVGDELADSSYAWKTMIDKKIHVSFGTDCPVESFNTMPNIYSAVTRKNITGEEKKIYLPKEKMNMYEAIRAYTYEGAYASGEEDIKGTISPGKLADFIILDRDLFNLSSNEEILDTHVLETYVDGKKVYSSL